MTPGLVAAVRHTAVARGIAIFLGLSAALLLVVGGVTLGVHRLLAAAEREGCKYLLSEDFQPGRTFGEVTVLNPFQRAPEEFFFQPG